MTAFKDTDVALLVGARPRGPGMERKDLLAANAQIFTAQGKALDQVGQAQRQGAGGRQPGQHQCLHRDEVGAALAEANFTAMLRLDHNRALSQLAAKTGKPVTSIEKLIVWGNHSPTMYPGLPLRDGRRQAAKATINDDAWYRDTFIPTVASAAPRSSKRAGCRRPRRPPTRRSTTCATGSSAPTGAG